MYSTVNSHELPKTSRNESSIEALPQIFYQHKILGLKWIFLSKTNLNLKTETLINSKRIKTQDLLVFKFHFFFIIYYCF